MGDNAFSRSWELTKVTLNVINKDKELLLYPIISGILSILFIVAMILPSIFILIGVGFTDGKINLLFQAVNFILTFFIYLGLSIIVTFFNVAIVYTTKRRFEGGNASFFESIGFAVTKLHLIILWGLLSATVGMILKIFEGGSRRAGGIGNIILALVRSIIGMFWSIITIFVVPAMVYYDVGPINAIKKSIEVLKKTWGESLIKYIGFGYIETLFVIIGILVFVPLVIIGFLINIIVMLIFLALAVVYFIAVAMFFRLANRIYDTALFAYASKGINVEGYSLELLKNTFKVYSKKKII